MSRTADQESQNVDVDIEIQLKATDLPKPEIDTRTRALAGQLRLLPHKSLGIINNQIPETIYEPHRAATEGAIALSLPAVALPAVVKLLQDRRDFILKGPHGAMLDLTSSVSQDQIDAWLNAAAKSIDSQTEIKPVSAAVNSALPDVQELREHARRHVESGAVTEEYLANRQQVLVVLNQVLATELVCLLRYKSHYYRAAGISGQAIKAEFAEHAREAQQHAEQVATRIVQLNGAPDFNPEGLTDRSRSEFSTGATVAEMIREDLIAERIAVEFYSAIIRWLGDSDLTTRKVMQDILAVEVQHAEDMKILLERLTRDNK